MEETLSSLCLAPDGQHLAAWPQPRSLRPVSGSHASTFGEAPAFVPTGGKWWHAAIMKYGRRGSDVEEEEGRSEAIKDSVEGGDTKRALRVVGHFKTLTSQPIR